MTWSRTGNQPGVSAVAYSTPKLGRTAEENEDSVAINVGEGRFAIADGASTSARPEVWSRLLVESFVCELADPLAPQVLTGIRAKWNTLVSAPNLRWYAQAKLMQGADSTFLGLHLDPAEGVFHAAGVGDSCLFHIRRHEILVVGPVDSSCGFNRFPELVSSRLDADPPKVTIFSGACQVGDVFLLATDALAKFLLEVYERYGRLPVVETFFGDRMWFIRRIAHYRCRGKLTNDDTTLCLVRA